MANSVRGLFSKLTVRTHYNSASYAYGTQSRAIIKLLAFHCRRTFSILGNVLRCYCSYILMVYFNFESECSTFLLFLVIVFSPAANLVVVKMLFIEYVLRAHIIRFGVKKWLSIDRKCSQKQYSSYSLR